MKPSQIALQAKIKKALAPHKQEINKSVTELLVYGRTIITDKGLRKPKTK